MSIDQGRHSLGVDFGTSNTVAVARWPDGRARPILVDGSPLLPSAVYAEPSGQLAVGRDAVHNARRDPGRFEPNPKRRIDDGLVLLGDQEFAVVDLIAAVLVRVADEWHRAVGPVRPEVTLTCPATWGATRRGLLAEAAARAGLEGARLVAEPVAAATYFAEVLGRDVPIGSVVVVHDFGAGTFDASVVARTAEGFEVLAVDGRDDVGGLDVDAAIVAHLGKQVAARDAATWQRLTEPATLEERRAQRQLWDDVRIAKERLSRIQSADVIVPLLDLEIHVTREELEELARPILDQTVRVTGDILTWANLPEGRLAGVFLVGGASRIPLVATLLHRALGEAPVVIEQPELVVAEGSILAEAALLASEPAAPGLTSEMRLVSRSGGIPAVTGPPVSVDDMETVPSSRSSLSLSGLSAASAAPPAAVDDMETVPAPRALVSSQLPPPAVDPWPDAQQHWVPDPEQTVASGPSWDRGSLPTSSAAAPTRPVAPPAHPTSPAGHPASPSAHPTSPAGHPASPSAHPTSPAGRPASPSARTVSSRPVSPATARSVTSGPPASTGRAAAAGRPATTSRWEPPSAPARPARRRSGGVLRFLQKVLSVLLLIVVPLVALLLAYSVNTGVPIESTPRFLYEDLRRLL